MYNEKDVWHDWLTRDLHQNEGELVRLQNQRIINSFAQKAIDNACLKENQLIIDAGSGEGTVSFLAIEQVGSSLRTVLIDISQQLLNLSKDTAKSKGVISQCEFIKAPMDSMTMIADNSVDRIITRASLAYVDNKINTLKEFLRVLKPGGMISLAEPIFQDAAMSVAIQKKMIDLQIKKLGSADRDKVLIHRWQSTQFPDDIEDINNIPFINFTERDLVTWSQESGFTNIHMEFHIDEIKLEYNNWTSLLNSSMHPLAPKLSEVLKNNFSEAEADELRELLIPGNTFNTALAKTHMAYLTAHKP